MKNTISSSQEGKGALRTISSKLGLPTAGLALGILAGSTACGGGGNGNNGGNNSTPEVVNHAPTLPSVSNKVLTVGVPFSATLPAGNDSDSDALSYSASGTPAGISFDTSSRVLSGTATTAGAATTATATPTTASATQITAAKTT